MLPYLQAIRHAEVMMPIKNRWNDATTAKITPAIKENVFSSISDHPKFRIELVRALQTPRRHGGVGHVVTCR
jgi:hypothetical protein